MTANEIYEDALHQIACFGDAGANKHLARTGSYGAFDEPSAVKLAREALRLGDSKLLSREARSKTTSALFWGAKDSPTWSFANASDATGIACAREISYTLVEEGKQVGKFWFDEKEKRFKFEGDLEASAQILAAHILKELNGENT